jgi:hypothetical protein
MQGPFDVILRKHAGGIGFKRYSSITSTGIDVNALRYDDKEVNALTREYKDKFVRLMQSKFKKLDWTRASSGPIINVDEAIAGEAECFRRKFSVRRAPLRIGINVSRVYAATEVVAIRGAAVLALIQLCKARGQQTQIEVCYGNGMDARASGLCHVRVELHNPNEELLTRINCSSNTLSAFGTKCVEPLARVVDPIYGVWQGYYRFHEFPWEQAGKHEFDFVLDRIETTSTRDEEEKVVEQLKKFGMV